MSGNYDNNNHNNNDDDRQDGKNDENFGENEHSLPHPEELKFDSKDDDDDNTSEEDWKTTLAGVAGNVLEWYDFAVFGYFGDVIGEVFFEPNQEGHKAMLESFLVFGGAFLMRPVGGILMGYIGDTYGSKRALELSIFLMAFPTFTMGCLPSYKSVGPVAILLLAIVRMLQGLSVGGQLMSSLVFTVESKPKNQWGLYGSYVMAAANVGTLLGSLVATSLQHALTSDQLKSWGWRIPFWSGILVSLSGVYLKKHGTELHGIPNDDDDDTTSRKNPIYEALKRENFRSLLSASLVPMLWSAGFYVSFVWMAVCMKDLVKPPVPEAFGVNTFSLFISVCAMFPLAGMLSDAYGRTRIMYFGGVGMALSSPLLLHIISYGNAPAALFAQCTLGILLCLWGAPMCAWLVESFEPACRLTSVAIGYNIAQATVGGLSPATATFISDKLGVTAVGFFLSIVAVIATTGLYYAPPLPSASNLNAKGIAFTTITNNESQDSDNPTTQNEQGLMA